MEIDFENALKFVDSIYHEDDIKNRYFNMARILLENLEHKIYNRAEKDEIFKGIDWLEREKIFHEALEDLAGEIWRDLWLN